MKQFLLAVVVFAAAAPAGAQAPRTPRDLVRASIDAMGGEQALKAIRSLKIDAMGHTYALEQSERPEGPHLVSYQQFAEIRDHERSRLWRRQEQRNWSSPSWAGPAGIVYAGDVVAINAGTRWGPHQPGQLQVMREDMAMSPERMLFSVIDAPDLAFAPDRVLHGIRNRALRFSRGSVKYTLYLNSHTNMPTMLESIQDDVFGIWGDVKRERWYTYWTLQPGGWQFPQQITSTWNGLPLADYTVFGVAVNEPVDDALFAIPEETKAAFRKMADAGASPTGFRGARLDLARAIKVTGDVVLLPGSWNVTLVRQPDGIVVLEAPIGSQYSAQVIDAAAKFFPGAPIKAVVSTSDAWPHLAGVREYVARGIPIYAMDLNLPILQRLVASVQTAAPDALSKGPRKPVFRAVSRRTSIGSGTMRIDVVPVRGEGSERMMIAYLPALKLLYASDLLQWNRDRTSFFHPVYPAEAAAAVRREDLGPVDRAWAMHMEPIEWTRVTSALQAIRAQK